ncbi:MAG TPA: AMP-binding protein [Acetobacteraceae bacterium]|nr:AMP-binding protein [Acetobacteraceae bacterium]
MTMTLIEALHQHARSRPKSIAFQLGEDVWTYQRLVDAVERLARGLVGRGLGKGNRVALHMANVPELAVALCACFQIGAIAAPLNIRLKSAELRPLLQQLLPTLYIGQADLYRHIAATDASIVPWNARFIVGDAVDDPWTQGLPKLLEEGDARPLNAEPEVHAPAVLLATSGTTGQPRFVTHTQATLNAITGSARYLGLDGAQTAAIALPLADGFGLFLFLACLRFGVTIVFVERFDPDAVLDAIERHGCTWLPGVPAMFGALLERQRARARNVRSLKICLSSGDVCPPRLQEQFPTLFGTQLRSFWGATEAAGSLTYGSASGPVSRIVKGAEVCLIDDSGAAVPRGEVGELALRGPNVTIGYWAGPGLIEDALKDGWFHTGDLMRQGDNDDLWFVSRGMDVIIRGGLHISPAEIERVLTAHPAVRDAAVVGVPDPALGQRVAGFVQMERGTRAIILKEILAGVTALLAEYKVPERLEMVDAIPRNGLGKIDRESLLAKISGCEGNDGDWLACV